jgi:putative SOS response-associated peptidase YedK
MCNRFRGLKDWSQLSRKIGGARLNFEYNPNVAPTESVPVLLSERGQKVSARMARFGIVLKSTGERKRPPLLNARTDSLKRGSFKSMLSSRHCVIPAEGFYEWRDEDGAKQPYLFARKDGKPLMLAGIWDWSDVKGDKVPSFAILTEEPNELIASYHDRMPVVVKDGEKWLDPDTPLEDAGPLPLEAFVVRPVNRALNNAREKDIEKIDSEALPPEPASKSKQKK